MVATTCEVEVLVGVLVVMGTFTTTVTGVFPGFVLLVLLVLIVLRGVGVLDMYGLAARWRNSAPATNIDVGRDIGIKGAHDSVVPALVTPAWSSNA